MASLFGRNALAERAQQIETDNILDHVALIRTWLDDYETGSLKKDTETSREQQYNADFFVKILGYRAKPANPYTFDPKDRTETNKQIPDAVLRFTDSEAAVNNISAVVELKGASINLDKPQQREGNLSPVQQGFKYKPQYASCPFVVVCNFYEFRLYNDNQLDFEVWTLQDLVDSTDDYLKFKKWYVLMCADNMVSAHGKSKTEALLTDIRQKQERVGEQFYADYKRAREHLLEDVYLRNPSLRLNFAAVIPRVQTIIDRLMFACFAEDSNLLPEGTLARIERDAANSSNTDLWGELRDFFSKIDRGSHGLGIPRGYNGGLFASNQDIDELIIADAPLLTFTRFGAKYDFEEDLRVNILGHVFEQSISDLEEIRQRVAASRNPFATATTNSIERGRRRKEGIFYTPDHIVRFIVDETLGEFLREKEQLLKKKYNLSAMKTEASYQKREHSAYLEYQQILQQVKVLDPACGSGAFLVYAYDYLLAENKRVGEILHDDTFYSSEVYARHILTENLYGVDLNEESVEIAKLSLWLKTAEKGKPLTSLDSNICCGNSLIDDFVTAGVKAFEWDTAFGDRLRFDVVFGNPPYVDSESMVVNNPLERVWIAAKYECAAGNWDLFVPFVQRAVSLLKEDVSSRFGFIIPNKVLGADYAAALRRYIDRDYALTGIADVSREKVFADADVYPIILTVARGDLADRARSGVKVTRSIDPRVDEEVEFKSSFTKNWTEYLAVDRKLLDALAQLPRLGGSLNVHASTTVNEAYLLVDHLEDKKQTEPGMLRLINTGTIDRYITTWGVSPTRYIKKSYRYPTVQMEHAAKKPWLNHPRIVVAGMSVIVEAYPDPSMECFAGVSTVVVTTDDIDELYYATGVLNSPVTTAYFKEIYKSEAMAGGYINVKPGGVRDLPFVPFNARSARHMRVSSLARQLQEALTKKQNFIVSANNFLFDMYGVKPGRSGDLIGAGFASVRKRIRGLSVKSATELHEWFSVKQEEYAHLKSAAEGLDREIADLVAAIFGVGELMITEESPVA